MKSAARNRRIALFFLAPSLAGFSIFYILPFFAGGYYSLVSSPINGKFVGLANYTNLLNNSVFLNAAKNTFVFTGVSVPLNMAFSLGFAMLLARKIYMKRILRTLFITPLVIPVASVVLVWQILFNSTGTVNYVLNALGFQTIDWLGSDWARLVVVIVYLWKNAGYNMILFLAGLQNIPVEYYESAEIDGAGFFRKFTSITCVYLTPTAFFVMIMSIINSFKVFRETWMLAGDYPHDSIYMLQHYMNNMFASLDYQKLTSAAYLMALLIVLLVFCVFSMERKIGKSIY
ncbi:MAG: sugar ABC transporter permease [Ruminiclostridium sp.]|nr:sugar ABC transporter permease [Ruminiclostridium sp.]